jgi:hypothetical protein
MNLVIVFWFLAFCSLNAWATPVLWTLQGFTFPDGGTASGSFVYDNDTNTYSKLNITTTAGSARGGSSYTIVNPNVSPSASGFFAATTSLTAGSPGLIIGFSTLTNVGGTILPPFVIINEGPYSSGLNGLQVNSTYRVSNNGQFTGVPVPQAPTPTPLPPSIILSLSGLAGAGLYMARGKFARSPK